MISKKTQVTTAAELKAWRKHMATKTDIKITQDTAAIWLGLSKQGYQAQETSKRAVSTQTSLLCDYLSTYGPLNVVSMLSEDNQKGKRPDNLTEDEWRIIVQNYIRHWASNNGSSQVHEAFISQDHAHQAAYKQLGGSRKMNSVKMKFLSIAHILNKLGYEPVNGTGRGGHNVGTNVEPMLTKIIQVEMGHAISTYNFSPPRR
ncbi:MAG: hypothetical protein Alpg2KO_01000 [Alphaproteobacteria bacterium]